MRKKTLFKKLVLFVSFIVMSILVIANSYPQGDCSPGAPLLGFGTRCCKYSEMFGSQFTIVEKCCSYVFWINTGCERTQTLDLPGGNGPLQPVSTIEP